MRFIAALIAIFSFTLQTYVVQTHIHAPGFEVSGLGQVNHPSPLGKDNQDDCPYLPGLRDGRHLCHAGAYHPGAGAVVH